MLVLTRKIGETIVIDGGIKVTVVKIDGNKVRLAIDAPLCIDRRLGGGVPLPQRLQERLRDPEGVNVLDRILTAVYAAWEVEPHLALAAVLALRELHPAAGAAGLGYAIALGIALVYLGEHYVVDLLAGAALAGGVAVLARPLAPVARLVDDAWRRIEP